MPLTLKVLNQALAVRGIKEKSQRYFLHDRRRATIRSVNVFSHVFPGRCQHQTDPVELVDK